eukprot:gb/GECH01000233.1/.p1 GENE.gb/GECH01000233.1/~~gb/GECH01000233.1/.p1  ORF type:complete len:217 (+),score=65.12 gb/GECH01000233.1/:1-651(+)
MSLRYLSFRSSLKANSNKYVSFTVGHQIKPSYRQVKNRSVVNYKPLFHHNLNILSNERSFHNSKLIFLNEQHNSYLPKESNTLSGLCLQKRWKSEQSQENNESYENEKNYEQNQKKEDQDLHSSASGYGDIEKMIKKVVFRGARAVILAFIAVIALLLTIKFKFYSSDDDEKKEEEEQKKLESQKKLEEYLNHMREEAWPVDENEDELRKKRTKVN